MKIEISGLDELELLNRTSSANPEQEIIGEFCTENLETNVMDMQRREDDIFTTSGKG